MVSPRCRTFGPRRERRIAPALLLGHLPDDKPAVLDLFSDAPEAISRLNNGAFPGCRASPPHRLQLKAFV
jgi:hypothetical protein